ATAQKSSFSRPLLGRYDYLPCELFRINDSNRVTLRDYKKQIELENTAYALRIHEDGLVHPKPGPAFEGPNGASVRSNRPFLQEIVCSFRGRKTVIYRLPEGMTELILLAILFTLYQAQKLPSDLVCLQEHTDHHSIHCAVPMSLREFDTQITEFLHKYGEAMTKGEFEERYPFL
ncbi:hypothetical protein IW261DRAFT_1345835, partial [Armillaria novae-zelandiae]